MQIDITQEQRERASRYVHLVGNPVIDDVTIAQLELLRQQVVVGISNDKCKPNLPEAYKTSLVWTINARSLQNFLELRTSKSALWEIRELAYAIYDKLPTEHQYLFTDSLYMNGVIRDD